MISIFDPQLCMPGAATGACLTVSAAVAGKPRDALCVYSYLQYSRRTLPWAPSLDFYYGRPLSVA